MKNIFKRPRTLAFLAAHVVMVVGGISLCFVDNQVLIAVGASLAAAGLAGWMLLAYVLISEDTSDRLKMIFDFGFVKAFDGRSTRIREEYTNKLTKARKHIDIIGFGLSAFREDFEDQFAAWKGYASVRVLLLDPCFPSVEHSYASQRDREEHNAGGKIAGDVRHFLDLARQYIGKRGAGSFKIRQYKCLPTLNVFRIDDVIFWGPYLIGEQSRNSPTFLVKKGSILFDKLLAHFDGIWDSDEFSTEVKKDLEAN